MTAFAIGLLVVSILLLLYAVWARAWLKTKPWAQGFFAWIEPIEITLFKKSETILFGRLLAALGGVLTILTQFGEINLTPFMPFVPEAYQAYVNIAVNCLPLLITAVGWMVEKLRNATTAPIEIVSIAEKDKTPEVKEAIAMADATKVEAVQAVAKAV